MSHCHDEHESHEHDHDGPDRGTETSLYSCIDRDNIRCLNESAPGSGKNVIKPWHERNDTTKAYILTIFFFNCTCNSFTGSVKLKSISIKSGPGDSCPSKMKAYINREDIDFDTVDSYTATQEWELISSPDNIEYITRPPVTATVTPVIANHTGNSRDVFTVDDLEFGQHETSAEESASTVRFTGVNVEATTAFGID
ncbi:16678_t:CDS:2, partial [Dentiscutata erythropus]